MLEKILIVLVAGVALVATGCESCDCNGEGDGDGDADADVDGGGDADGDADGDSGPYTFDVHAYEQSPLGERGDALSGVAVTVETAVGRQDAVTGEDGVAEIILDEGAEWFTMTLAGEGHTVVTVYQATTADVEHWIDVDGEVAIDVPTLEAAEPVETVEISVTAQGIPAGMRYCASAAPYLVTCGTSMETAYFDVEETDQPVPVTGFVIDDAAGALVDFAEVELEDGLMDREAHLVFDGTADLAPTSVDITLTLPADAESVFRADGLYQDGPFPVIIMEPGTYLVRGGATGEVEAAGGDAIDMTVTWFGEAEELLLHGFALYPGEDFETYTFRWFSEELTADSYDFLDVPRVSEPLADGDLSSTFTWQPIEGADRYGLYLLDEEGRVLWTALSDHATSVVLPDLPVAYDGADWPTAGSPGTFVVFAWQSPFDRGDPAEPLLVDRQESLSPLFDVSLGR